MVLRRLKSIFNPKKHKLDTISKIFLGTGLQFLCFQPLSQFFSISPTLAASVILQEHQKTPVNYLLNHPNLRGILLFHALGSGKTYTALNYCERSKQEIIILLPQFLKSNWITQMQSFGITHPERYQLIAFEEIEKFLKTDLTNKVLVIDEIHKIIEKIRSNSQFISEKSIKIYSKIKEAQKLILLTGTPIFTETSDLSYIANLLDTQNYYPVDPIKFKTEYMKIKPVTSLVRGHILESKLFFSAFPIFTAYMSSIVLGPFGILPVIAGSLAGSLAFPIINELNPTQQVAFREFDPEKWRSFVNQYISYYEIPKTDNKYYPQLKIQEEQVDYNRYQLDFFLAMVDQDLSLDQLKILLKTKTDNEVHHPPSSEFVQNPTSLKENPYELYLTTHSQQIQKEFFQDRGVGREIGNLEFYNTDAETPTLIEPTKFVEILKKIKQCPGKIAVYSNYYSNGIKKFSEFLDRQGLQKDYLTLLPWQTPAEQIETLAQYNQGKCRILLMHPEITEGISLIGTEQFHILEPILNSTLLTQIIGRAVRYQSHSHLPKNRQVVSVHIWESQIHYGKLGGLLPTESDYIRKTHWQRKYTEINPNAWTKGIIDVDQAYFLKNETPDQRVKRYHTHLSNDLESFKSLLRRESIEQFHGQLRGNESNAKLSKNFEYSNFSNN